MTSERNESDEKSVLNELDFADYGDPVVRSIHDWHMSGQRWSRSVRSLFISVTVQGRWDPAKQRLDDATEAYVESFERAAATVVADSLIAEKAVEALGKLIRADEKNRRAGLRKDEPLLAVSSPPPRYVQELAYAYGDPQGALLPLNKTHEFDPNVLARMSYLARLEDHASVVLGDLRTVRPESRPSPSERSSRSLARRAFGPYLPTDDQ